MLPELLIRDKVSIHAPREGCDPFLDIRFIAEHVSIHAPREGCDEIILTVSPMMLLFQFTHPGRGATYCKGGKTLYILVSIHAPREGCDRRTATHRRTT